MMRSLYSGISGLRNHQTRMDVIGNNIANVNTTGYKTSRVIFQDIFSQTAAGGTAARPQENIGGTNPMQIGLGIKLATVDVLHTPAPIARTDNPFDMMIEGDGYFIVQNENTDYFYTRAGNFYLDSEGYLVNAQGYYVMGYGFDQADPPTTYLEIYELFQDPAETIVFDPPRFNVRIVTPDDGGTPPIFDPPEYDYDNLQRIRLRVDDIFSSNIVSTTDAPDFMDLVGFNVGQDGSVSVIINNIKETIAFLGVAMFSNPGGLEKAGNSLYRAGPASGEPVHARALENGSGRINGGGLEMSNVDLATEFTDMIVTQRGFQANSRIITVSDSMLEELVNLKR